MKNLVGRVITVIRERSPAHQAAKRIEEIDQQFHNGKYKDNLTMPKVAGWYRDITDLIHGNYLLSGKILDEAESVLQFMMDNYLGRICLAH